MSYQCYLTPELFQNSYLFELEKTHRLPLRLALLGLACCADKSGRFRWESLALKQFIFPHDAVDVEKIMDILGHKGFLVCHYYEGQAYGVIAKLAPSLLHKHQTPPPINV